MEAIDKGGNFIGWLYVDNTNLSVALVEAGLAKVHFTAERSSHYKTLLAAQERAKAAKLKVCIKPEVVFLSCVVVFLGMVMGKFLCLCLFISLLFPCIPPTPLPNSLRTTYLVGKWICVCRYENGCSNLYRLSSHVTVLRLLRVSSSPTERGHWPMFIRCVCVTHSLSLSLAQLP